MCSLSKHKTANETPVNQGLRSTWQHQTDWQGFQQVVDIRNHQYKKTDSSDIMQWSMPVSQLESHFRKWIQFNLHSYTDFYTSCHAALQRHRSELSAGAHRGHCAVLGFQPSFCFVVPWRVGWRRSRILWTLGPSLILPRWQPTPVTVRQSERLVHYTSVAKPPTVQQSYLMCADTTRKQRNKCTSASTRFNYTWL